MAYIGTNPLVGRYAILDDISAGFNGSSTAFGMTVAGQTISPELAQNVLVVVNGEVLTPSGGVDYGTSFGYGVAGPIINFRVPPTAGQTFYGMVFGSVLGIGGPSDGTVKPGSISQVSGTNFIFPGDISASGDLDLGGNIQAVTISGSTAVRTTFIKAVSGEIGTLDITNDLNVKNITLEEDVTVSGDLSVSGNIFTATGNIQAQNGTIIASSGTITGLAAPGLNSVTANITNLSNNSLSGVTAQFTTEVSGATVVGGTVTGIDKVTSQSGIFTNISGQTLQVSDLTVTGKFTITGFPSITGFVGGDLHVQGIFANSGVISGTLSGQTITGNTVQATTGTFQTINISSIDFTDIEAATGIFTSFVSGAEGTFDVLNLPPVITGTRALFTEVVSGLMVSGKDANIADDITTSGLAAQFINVKHAQIETLHSQTFISGNNAADPITVTGTNGAVITTSGVIIYGPVTILR
jgi:cytoskeletal protein CcmA (bactofilin family)